MTTAWLRDLEEKVNEASTRLQDARTANDELQQQNEALQARVGELENEVAEAASTNDAAWTEERDEIRSRVEKLANHLGELLES